MERKPEKIGVDENGRDIIERGKGKCKEGKWERNTGKGGGQREERVHWKEGISDGKEGGRRWRMVVGVNAERSYGRVQRK